MSFTTSNVSKLVTQIKQRAGVLFQPQQVDMYGGGTVYVKLSVRSGLAGESELSGGAVQDINLIAKIDGEDWDTKVGRPPQKGDVIHWMGRRHAVERSIAIAPDGNLVFYKARLAG